MDCQAKPGTRHKEYSLVVAVAATALTMVPFMGSNIFLLAILNIFSIFSILYSAFSVVRHADVLAHRFGEPYGSLILSLAIVVLEASLISILMLTGAASDTLMRDTIYSVVMIVMAGLSVSPCCWGAEGTAPSISTSRESSTFSSRSCRSR